MFSKMKGAGQMDQFKEMGKHQFTGIVAETYLKKHGSSAEIMADSSWVSDEKKADAVAAAVLDW